MAKKLSKALTAFLESKNELIETVRELGMEAIDAALEGEFSSSHAKSMVGNLLDVAISFEDPAIEALSDIAIKGFLDKSSAKIRR